MEKKQEKNWLKEWWGNLRNTKKNFQKVRASPYASLVFALKVRKMILIPLILFIIWKGYTMIRDYHASGFMGIVGKVIMLAVFIYLIYRIYATIPQAKKRIEYYKKYPHLINYCPTNVKEDVDDIINKIKQNKINVEEAQKENVPKKTENSRETNKGNSKTTRS